MTRAEPESPPEPAFGPELGARRPPDAARPRPIGTSPHGSSRPARLKVAYVLLSDQAGGAERQMLALAERLDRDRFSPELIVRSSQNAHVQRARRAGIPVRATAAPSAAPDNPAGTLRSRAAQALGLVRAVRRARYDIVDAWLYPADVAMALARPMIHRPVVISGRRNLDAHDRFGRLERLIGAAARHQTDIVVANSAAAASHAVLTQAVDPARIRIIRNGVELPDPISADERTARRHALGRSPTDIVVGCMASYTPTKRLDLLIEAFASVARDEPDATLELVGDGPLRAALAAQVRAAGLEDRVCLHGFEPEPERFYPAFDIVALSSDREGLPNALLEAGAAGRAIVSTAAGGASEIVTDGETGLLVSTGDVDGLARSLGRLVRDPQLRERLGQAIRPSIATAFGMDRFVAEFATLYEERVEARRRRRARPTRAIDEADGASRTGQVGAGRR